MRTDIVYDETQPADPQDAIPYANFCDIDLPF